MLKSLSCYLDSIILILQHLCMLNCSTVRILSEFDYLVSLTVKTRANGDTKPSPDFDVILYFPNVLQYMQISRDLFAVALTHYNYTAS